MVNRTKTYIAADWTGDSDAVEKLHQWNESKYWSLSFVDVHDFIQAYDCSLPCSIKKSLKQRMDISKTFVLIVGSQTNSLTKGKCRFCKSYNSYTSSCARGYSLDNRSYIEFECEKAVEAGIKIVVLYNYANIYREKCPLAVRYKGKHVPMCYYKDGKCYWDYNAVKDALCN